MQWMPGMVRCGGVVAPTRDHFASYEPVVVVVSSTPMIYHPDSGRAAGPYPSTGLVQAAQTRSSRPATWMFRTGDTSGRGIRSR
jgi:hypothetical protein